MSSETLRGLANLQPAVFERLASQVLRAHPPYESLIPTGLNEQGRPVPAPTDGVCWVPDTDPPKGVLFAYTAVSRKALRAKWLSDRTQSSGRRTEAREGDVVKAIRRAQEIRGEIPQAVFTLVLACTVDPPEDLVTAVKARCLEANVEVDFWAASRLANFLDHEPRGQWLRRDFLGIPIERVSTDLLARISDESCRAYADFLFEKAGSSRIEREIDRKLWEDFRRGTRGVRFLAAESGLGKSYAALGLLRRNLACGGVGLWLRPEEIAVGGGVANVVEAALRARQPKLLPGCGTEALELAASRGGFLLVVDDLSRAAAPSTHLLRLASWTAGTQQLGDGGSREGLSSWLLLCPIWPRFFSQLPETARKEVQALSFEIGTYTPAEGATALQARAQSCGSSLTEMEAQRLSESLGHDPLLIGLLDLDGRERWSEAGHRPISLDVLDRFLEEHRSRLAQQEDARFGASDYEDALLDLADKMLEHRELAPSWRRIASWFQSRPDQMAMLRQINADGQISRLLRREDEEVIHFRHDRVRDAILAAALARSMKNGHLAQEVLGEPFYADLLGQALLARGVESVWVDRLRERNPLSLFRALQVFETPRNPLQEAIVAALRAWLAQEVATGRALDALQWEAVGYLAETDSPLVLELSRTFPDSWYAVLQARFRNGDVAAAATYCARMSLGVPFQGFMALVEHVKARFGSSFVRELTAILSRGDLSEEEVRGALVLAGYLSEQTLWQSVQLAWAREAQHRLTLLTEFLWAILRCLHESEEEANRLIDPVCDAWRELPGESAVSSKRVENVEVIEPLQHALPRSGLSSRAVLALIRRATGSLEWPIAVLLTSVDVPEAVEFTVRQAAAILGEWRYTWTWEHSDFTGIRLGSASTTRLKELWRALEEDPQVREKAFRFWSIAEQLEPDAITDLQGVERSEPFYRGALRHRIRLGDRTATAELIRMTETDEFPHFWWHDAHRIWGDDLKKALDSFLGRLPEDGRAGDWEWGGHHFGAAEVLVEIPPADAEELLLRHWGHLKYRSIFVQAALAVGTPRCCERVAEVVRSCPEPKRLLERFEYHCGIRFMDRGQQFGLRQLKAVIPYLDLLSEETIENLWRHCNEQRWFDFRRLYLDARLTEERRRRNRLGRESLFQAFDRFLGERWSSWSVELEIKLSQGRGESWADFLGSLLAWLEERQTLRALDVVAHALVWAGSRADLARLRKTDVAAEPAEIHLILDRTTFQVFRRRLI